MGSGASAPGSSSNEKSQSPTEGIWSPVLVAKWKKNVMRCWCLQASCVFWHQCSCENEEEVRQKDAVFLTPYRILEGEVENKSTDLGFGFARLELYPKGLDSLWLLWSTGTGNIATNSGNVSAKVPATLSKYLWASRASHQRFHCFVGMDSKWTHEEGYVELRKWDSRSQRKHCPVTAMCLGEG